MMDSRHAFISLQRPSRFVMSPEDSVTQWIALLKEGQSTAAERLWGRYFDRLVALARQKLEGANRQAADEEDIALSAFYSLCAGARAGQFAELEDRNNLWLLLVAITTHKSIDLIRRENRQKRGGAGRASGERVGAGGETGLALATQIQSEPSPEFTVQVAEQFNRLLDRLDATGDPTLRKIALWRMEGHENSEICARLGCVIRTVQRKLSMIGRLWAKELDP
jgi:DNA-directed RNA polymerase specialized sigma24 family protein